MRLVDSLFSAIGKPRRVPGAAYSDEWWGDIPAAAPLAVFEGVRLPELHRVVTELGLRTGGEDPDWETAISTAKARSITAMPPTVAVQQAEPESEEDWEQLILAAKRKAG